MKNNALEFSHNEPIRARVISATNTSHIIIISNDNWTDWSTIHIPNRTFLVRFGGISGEFGRAMVRILARRSQVMTKRA